MSLAALDDIAVHSGTTEPIEGVVRIETSPLEETAPHPARASAQASTRADRCSAPCSADLMPAIGCSPQVARRVRRFDGPDPGLVPGAAG